MKTDEIEKLLAEATPGPWIVRTLENFGWNIVHYLNGDKFKIYRVSKSNDEADARLIAMAPDLAAEVLRLRKALKLYATPQNWRMSGPCDPNGHNFIGEEHARAALAGKGE